VIIREVRPEECAALGELTVAAYAEVAGDSYGSTTIQPRRCSSAAS
jgi:hypothetical protein